MNTRNIYSLGDICDIYQPKTISTEMLCPDGQYLVYGANGVIGRYNQYNHEESEVLMTCRGATCGSINVSEPFSWINGNAMVIHPKAANTFGSRAFLVYLLKSLDLSCVITGCAQPQITRQSLSPLKVYVPSLAEQERIVAELDLLSGIIDKQKAQLKELDTLAQSIFYDMFGNPVENEKGWLLKTIGDTCILKSGNSSANDSSSGDLPYVKVGDLNLEENNPYINTSSVFVNREENRKGIFPIGTTVFPKRGGAILTNKKRMTYVDICCDLNIMGVIPTKELLPIYLYYYFLHINMGKLFNGAAIPQINNCDIAPLKIVVPPLDMQKTFADIIQFIDKQKMSMKTSLKESQKLFDYTMDKYFS